MFFGGDPYSWGRGKRPFRVQASDSCLKWVPALLAGFKRVFAGSSPHQIMGTTRDYCRKIKSLSTPYLGASAVVGD